MPKSFQSKLAKEKHLLSVEFKSFIETMNCNVVGPFKFLRQKGKFVFSLRYCHLDECLPTILQLQRASTLPPVDQNAMIAAFVYSRQMRTDFNSCLLEAIQETVLFKTIGNKITPLVVNPGIIVLTDVILYFQPFNNAEATPVIKVKLNSIKRIFQRRFFNLN